MLSPLEVTLTVWPGCTVTDLIVARTIPGPATRARARAPPFTVGGVADQLPRVESVVRVRRVRRALVAAVRAEYPRLRVQEVRRREVVVRIGIGVADHSGVLVTAGHVDAHLEADDPLTDVDDRGGLGAGSEVLGGERPRHVRTAVREDGMRRHVPATAVPEPVAGAAVLPARRAVRLDAEVQGAERPGRARHPAHQHPGRCRVELDVRGARAAGDGRREACCGGGCAGGGRDGACDRGYGKGEPKRAEGHTFGFGAGCAGLTRRPPLWTTCRCGARSRSGCGLAGGGAPGWRTPGTATTPVGPTPHAPSPNPWRKQRYESRNRRTRLRRPAPT